MIVSTDVDFHHAGSADPLWTETTYLAFHSVDDALHGTCYVLARPNLGIAMSSVVVARGFRERLHEVDHVDPQIHLPCPESYSKFDLPNGLSVHAETLTDWRFTYQHALGNCSFDLKFSGSHEPYDPADPEQNPAKARPADGVLLGDAWSHGHFDIKGRITGALTLHGREYEIDCHDGMDRSWGPRNETPKRATAYVSANFGRGWSMWLTVFIDLARDGTVSYGDVNSGFIVEDGDVTPVVSASIEADTTNLLTQSDRINVTDAKGRVHELTGAAIGTRPVGSLNPSIAAFQSLMRYERDGTTGYGGHGKLFGLAYIQERLR